jgi:adenine deaminase
MATINPATEMRIERDHGSISAGKYADIVLVDDIEKISVDSVLYHGELVVTGGRYIRRPSSFRFPGWAKQTIQVTAPVDASTLLLHVNTARPHVECKAIVQQEIKRLRRVTLPVIDGAVQCDPDQDVVHVAVLDRYNRSGRVGHGFAYGTGIKAGAVASTINHNAHNLFALGRNANDMAIALDRLIAIGGGYVLVKDSVVISELALPVIGMISEQPLEDVAQGFRDAEAAVASLGCTYDEQPLLRLSFFCAPVIRHVGLTDFGLINTDTFQREDVTLDA